MNLIDVYDLIYKAQKAIGNDCRIDLRVPFDNTLEFDVHWFNKDTNKIINYVHVVSIREMKYVDNLIIFMNWFIAKAIHEYEAQNAKDLSV